MQRRSFINNSLLATSSLFFFPVSITACQDQKGEFTQTVREKAVFLLEQWCKGLYSLQTIDPANPEVHGGIYSPGDNAYPGRCADAIYPFLWMASRTKDKKYLQAALDVYQWEQYNCWNEEYGCWFNDPGESDGWKSISVFSAITKMEAIEHYGDLLEEKELYEWKNRLLRVAEYIYTTFHIGYANINYPASATLAMQMLGKLFNEEK